MFGHIFINRLKCIVRDRALMFWIFMYPMVLALFFALAFSNLSSNDGFTSFPVAVVDNEEYRGDKALQAALSSVSSDNAGAGTKLCSPFACVGIGGADRLRRGDVRGYILLDGGAHVVVRESGPSNILKLFMDSYLQDLLGLSNDYGRRPVAGAADRIRRRRKPYRRRLPHQ
jgi:ABC-2 type transport system permease protein